MIDSHPPAGTVVVGVGARRGVTAAEVLALIGEGLAEAGLTVAAVHRLATLDARTGEPGLRQAAAALGVPLLGHPAAVLAAVRVPGPSARVLARVGTPSVAEAAALAGLRGGELLVPKLRSAMATVAVGRGTTGPPDHSDPAGAAP
ncbi:cobalamin biosynthesis protein [Kitasatospora sp. NPDC057223]|uniref:cobalamin biosynthesis protein n=1 Tax=Kitasatospora sp. NPDC057223 TaxID=3346055 RepID=UPI00363FA0DE